MNERIKELFLKAEFDSIGDETQTKAEFNSKFIPILAELIVKECASICKINGQSYQHSFTPARARLAESTSNHCAMMIERHFGVEE